MPITSYSDLLDKLTNGSDHENHLLQFLQTRAGVATSLSTGYWHSGWQMDKSKGRT